MCRYGSCGQYERNVTLEPLVPDSAEKPVVPGYARSLSKVERLLTLKRFQYMSDATRSQTYLNSFASCERWLWGYRCTTTECSVWTRAYGRWAEMTSVLAPVAVSAVACVWPAHKVFTCVVLVSRLRTPRVLGFAQSLCETT